MTIKNPYDLNEVSEQIGKNKRRACRTPESAGSFFEVKMTFKIPTTQKAGSNPKPFKEYLREHPDFALGYLKTLNVELKQNK